MRETLGKLFSKISPELRRRVIVGLGVVGLALIFLSGFIHTEPAEPTAEPPPESTSGDDYRAELERDLEAMISAIDGAGAVRVMITMESTAEDVYAVDKSESESKSLPEGASQPDTQRSEENEYVIIKGRDGGEQTVLKKQRMPEIRGVLVVCDGGGSSVTKEKITAAVAGVLGVPGSKVVVTN